MIARSRARHCQISPVWNQEWAHQHLALSRKPSWGLTLPLRKRFQGVKSFPKRLACSDLHVANSQISVAHTVCCYPLQLRAARMDWSQSG